MPLGAFDSQYEDSINDIVDSLVSNDSTHSQQPPADHAALSSHPLSLNQHHSSNEISPGKQFDVLGLNNDFGSFITDAMNGHFRSDKVGTFNVQDQGQLVWETAQPNSRFLGAMSPLATPNPQTVAAGPNPSILLETSQHGPSQSRQRAITSAGGLHLCHIHHNLIQSFAEFKPSVSLIHFTSSTCVLCTKRQSTSFQHIRNIAARSMPRPANPRTNKSARRDTHSSSSSHTTGVFYCSFAECNRSIDGPAGDQPFNRNDNTNEHEHRVHGILREGKIEQRRSRYGVIMDEEMGSSGRLWIYMMRGV